MKIAISGTPGVGKTTVAKELSKKLNLKYYNLNDYSKKHKIAYIKELKTYDFDLDELFEEVEKLLKDKDNYIIESHYSHYINPEYIDYLIIINREITNLKNEYLKRDYPEKKIRDNLDSEIFNVCYFESIETHPKEKIILIENNNNKDIANLVNEIIDKINEKEKQN